jgi:hypothetical protein
MRSLAPCIYLPLRRGGTPHWARVGRLRFVTPRLEGLRILERSRILRPSRRGVTKRAIIILSTTYSTLILLCDPPPRLLLLIVRSQKITHLLIYKVVQNSSYSCSRI